MNDDFSDQPISATHTPVGKPAWERATLEKLVFATIKEQRAARRWRLVMRMLWLLLIGMVIWYVYSAEGSSTATTTPHTAVIDIRGEIASGADASAEK